MLDEFCPCLQELGVEVDWDDLAAAFVEGFEAVFGISLDPGSLTEGEQALSDSLVQDYTSTAWSQCV